METKIKPIPAFYCCYLLRSTVRHGSLYVGSSPNPVRRLNQHNGGAKGGAVRTSRLSLRPWEMTCIVAGFPSNIAALQFEWAWQNSHLTRHIASDERISFPVTKMKTNSKTGKNRRKPTRPPSSLIDKLSNLHLLLRSKYFSQWPLQLRFFNQDVYEKWRTWCERVDKQVRPEIPVLLDLAPPQPTPAEGEFSSVQRPKKRQKANLIGKGGIEGIDPTYGQYRGVFEKSQFLLDEGDEQQCEVCKKEIDLHNDIFTMCTNDDCTSLSHITCLSSEFLRGTGSGQLVPDGGKCPGCKTEVVWHDLMRAVSLRMRGEKEVQKLLKKKRGTKAATAAASTMEEEEESADDAEEDEELSSADLADEDEREAAENEMDDDDDDDDDDNMTVTSDRAPVSAKIEIVIEDSEDER